MGGYDSRRLTLDAGLTALALRAIQDRKSRYPFVDRYIRRRRGKGTTPAAAMVVGTGRAREPYVLIVDRKHPALVKALTRALGGAPQVLQVIPDRRTADRRGGSRVARTAERRRRERRRGPPVGWQLFGFLLAPRRGSGARGRRTRS